MHGIRHGRVLTMMPIELRGPNYLRVLNHPLILMPYFAPILLELDASEFKVAPQPVALQEFDVF